GTVVFPPDDQCRHANPVQPLAEARIVHIGTPAVERRGRPVAHDRGELVFVELAVIRYRACRIEKGSSKKFVGWKRVDVGDIALFAPAELDAKRVDQNEMPD